MNADSTVWIVVAIVVTVGVLWLAWKILQAGLLGVAALFAWAGESGFLGMAAFIACWVFMFPVMLVICPLFGFFLIWGGKEDEKF